MSEQTDMQALSGRASKLIDAISNAIMTTAEVAAERIELAAKVAQIEQRMTAFGAVIDAIAAQRERLEAEIPTAKGSRKALLARQVEMLQLQELAILERLEVPQQVAQQAVLALHAEPATHKRAGKRFVKAV